MTVISDELPDENSLFKIVIDVFYYSQCKNLNGFFDQKSKYTSCRDEFIRKFKIKYPKMSDEEVFNFMNIYLLYEPAEK